MRFRFHECRKGALLAILCLLVAPLFSCRSLILNPFSSANQLQAAMENSAMTLVNHRVRPATSVTGKRFLTLEECKALALSNNLDLQAVRLEELTQEAIRW